MYLEGVSGQRKATGSYFTKPFCVAHLLDEALEPTLRAHISRLTDLRNAGDEAGAAEAFFDFRCADIAMGSGHFLVAALDRIEARLSGWLADNPLPQVTAELDRLRSSALAALGDLATGVEIESSSLLRRQVARRCVYGVDLNPVAVELARLALWVHTFVPGLPLSFLDHNLVRGDSLTGVGTINEAMSVLGADETGLFAGQVHDLLTGSIRRPRKTGPHLRRGRCGDQRGPRRASRRQGGLSAVPERYLTSSPLHGPEHAPCLNASMNRPSCRPPHSQKTAAAVAEHEAGAFPRGVPRSVLTRTARIRLCAREPSLGAGCGAGA